MGNTTHRRTGANRLTRHPLTLACAAALLLASQASFAQDAATEPQTDAEKAEAAKKKDGVKELESVKVTGIRVGIENAIETKQTATSIVESVSAEDIGKLPDSSIAESIARLPGLTAQRERGRATQVNIRGFAGDFAGTTLNGREQTSAGDNRGVEFDQYPSELLSSVVVYKTPDAGLVGQGLSGTVDLRTARPLDFEDRVVSGNFRFDQNENNGKKLHGNRFSFSYIDQFADRTIGLAIGYAHMDSPNSGFQNESWGYPSERWNGSANVPSVPGHPGVGIIGGGKAYKFENGLERDGLMATLQFKPNDFYEGTIDAFYSKFKKTELKSGLEFGTTWAATGLEPETYTIDGNTVTNSTWENVKPVLRSDSNPIDDKQQSIGWNNIFHVNDHWDVTADLSYSRTEHDFRVLETYAGLANAAGSDLAIDLDADGTNHYSFAVDLNDPANLRLIDAGGWGQDGYVKDFEVVDRLTAFRLDAERRFDEGFISSIQFGYNRTDRSKDKSSIEAKLCIVACAPNNTDSAPFPGEASDFGFAGIDGFATFDANELLESGFYNLVNKFDKDIANKNWGVDETIDTLFFQANIDTDLGDKPLRGNIGFQYVSVDQESAGFSTYAGNPAGLPISAGASYNDFLPSLNLSLEAAPDFFVRFAAARQMARPRLDDMRASFDVRIANDCPELQGQSAYCGGGGNPQLKPWLADAYDLSLEKYFTTAAGNKGYVAAAYFFKDLQTYIFKDDRPFDFAGYPLPTAGQGQTTPTTTVGRLNQPFNGEGGILKGLELTISVPLDLLWAPLNGLGLQASYSDTKSSISPNGPGTSEPLPGLSKYVSNVTLYYEKAGFSIRLSQRNRSDFRAETRGFGADLGYVNIAAETVRDAQVNYAFGEDSSLHGLAFYLQMSNIGDEPFRTYDTANPELRPINYFSYGKTTLLGFSYKF